MATKYQQRRWSGLGKRCEVTAYIPPEHLVEIADDRTRGMVNYFNEMTRPPCSYWQLLNCIDNLARSCYLQGALDVAEAAAQQMLDRATLQTK